MRQLRWQAGKVVGMLLCALLFSSCASHLRETTTGCYLRTSNTYAHPSYPHGKVLNVLLLPVDNPLGSEYVELHREALVQAAVRNWGKFNYFNVQFDPHFHERAGRIVDVNTGFVDRAKLGIIGQDYNVDAILQVSVGEFRPYPPLRMQAKAIMLDANTGERLWAFDHTFDTEDSDVMNLMRIWWNDRIAGGKDCNRFKGDCQRPSVLSAFVFYAMAQCYGDMRLDNVATMECLRRKESCR